MMILVSLCTGLYNKLQVSEQQCKKPLSNTINCLEVYNRFLRE